MPHTGWKMDPSPPSAEHPLGTMQQQYDILYGLIWGTRNAFRIGVAVVAANLVIGIILGAIAGYFGGLVDEIIMRITDIFYAIPFLVMAMALVVALGRGLKAMILVLIILGLADLHAGDPQRDPGDPQHGLHPGRPGERRLAPADPVPPHPAQLDLLGAHPRLPEHRHHDPHRRRPLLPRPGLGHRVRGLGAR